MSTMTWSKRHDRCRECGTTRHAHKAKGLCAYCYALIRKIEVISSWDYSDPETLIGFPKGMPLVGDELVKRVQRGLIAEYRDRLNDLSRWESPPVQGLDGATFETLFNQVATHCKARHRNMFFGYANTFDWNFDKEQKQIIYQLLTSILRDIPWQPNWYRVFDRTRDKA